MVQSVVKFIEKENLLGATDKILLAVSGGVDSMVLLDIFQQLDFSYGVAHLNHGLRGIESKKDHDFVERICHKLSCAFYGKYLNIKELSQSAKSNLSDEGRQQRYSFFKNIMQSNGYSVLATAHHADDQIETFIMRSIYGSGLKGLSGIPFKQNQIIRPLINFSKTEILNYAESKQLEYREDSSNLKTDYLRNAVRLKLIPVYENLDPHYAKGMLKSIDNIKDSEQLIRSLSSKYLEEFITINEDKILISKTGFDLQGSTSLLFYAVSKYGFNRSQVADILSHHQPGAFFYSDTHRLLIDRDNFIITKRTEDQSSVDKIIEGCGTYRIDHHYNLTLQEIKTDSSNLGDQEIIDFKKISFPMYVRKWRDGDKFTPLGMKGQTQSVQDFLTNNKISRLDKENTYVLESNGQIIWLIGHRISESVKQDASTKMYLHLHWH